MKIGKIYIKKFQQFQDVELDFTDPTTGKPLEKICFIGSNGTGKSKLLKLITWFVTVLMKDLALTKTHANLSGSPDGKLLFQLLYNSEIYFVYYHKKEVFLFRINAVNGVSVDNLARKILQVEQNSSFSDEYWQHFRSGTLNSEFLDDFQFRDNAKDLLIYSPDEIKKAYEMGNDGVPKSSVDEALKLTKYYPYYSEVSPDEISSFWKLLIYNLRKREEERDTFEKLPESRKKIKDVLIHEFDSANPKILEQLAKVWNRILNKAGLEFDFEGASNPYQLTDNLRVYIRLIGTKQVIDYVNLSTGILNFIFRLGHIYSLYFNREIDRGLLLIDEPENGLFPDFLFDLMDTYNDVIVDKRGKNNTQVFFATHNPIVAAQFQPYERIVLDWNKDGSVSAKKGLSPLGDDPNDLLSNDFKLKDLMGPEGRKKWEEYQELKKKLIREKEKNKKEILIKEINQIGTLYNFS